MDSATNVVPEDGIKRIAIRYAIAALAAVVALLLRRLLAPLVGTQLVYMALWPAVVFSSWYCGVGPAILTVFVGVAGAWFWLLPHLHSLAPQHSGNEITSLIGFLTVSALIIVMGESNRRARERERSFAAEAVAATAKFQAIFQQSTVFAGIMSADGIILDANKLCLEMCGYRAEEVIGRAFWDCGWWHGLPEVQAKIRAGTTQAAGGNAYRELLPYRWADETERLVDFALHPIRDAHGQIIFLHPTGVDVTDLKNAEENYRTLAESLEEQVRVRTKELNIANESLRDLSARLLHMRDHEARRLARELHDSVGQLLAAISMNIAVVKPQAHKLDDAAAAAVTENMLLVEQISSEIRTISHLLHPPLLDELGLRSALGWYVDGFSERSKIKVELEISSEFGRLTTALETTVFRVVQECLTNVHRHSGSKTASIRITQEDRQILVKAQDSGKGISPDKLKMASDGRGGVGYRGMVERIRHLGGKLEIRSDGQGTLVIATLPYERPDIPDGNQSA